MELQRKADMAHTHNVGAVAGLQDLLERNSNNTVALIHQSLGNSSGFVPSQSQRAAGGPPPLLSALSMNSVPLPLMGFSNGQGQSQNQIQSSVSRQLLSSIQ